MTISESSGSPGDTVTVQAVAPKRSADAAGLKPGMRPAKSVKRRASKACQCCRARKVRCNVVEHGAPCTNCRLDEVECIVSESKRKKKWPSSEHGASPQTGKNGAFKPNDSSLPMSAHPPYEPLRRPSEHTPHTIYGDLPKDVSVPAPDGPPRSSLYTPNMLINLQQLGPKPGSFAEAAPMLPGMISPLSPSYSLPPFVKPLPSRLSMDDIMYLEKKGSLAIPPPPLRDELLRSYAEFIHPYMPLLNLHRVVGIIDRADGSEAVSLLLFQAIMFAGVASVDMRYLKSAGYQSRRDARRDFFAKTRLLYDFDVEVDRISLIQALLLMTYWYETPDDQKDSHHWMGIAVSLSHTIGLHRNPEKSASMDVGRQKLWKRIWWATYMRDRLVALGMRRPTRIKDADFDVPMLTIDDFEIAALPEGPSCIPSDCTYLRSADKQRQMAVMCIEKAKLCICVSDILSVQYSVLQNNHGAMSEEGSTKTTMMLVAKRMDPAVNEVQHCDKALQDWHNNLAEQAKYLEPTWSDVDAGNEDIALNRSLLHMIYYAALSALHRPQVLPSAAMQSRAPLGEHLEQSRSAVRLAATKITSIANRLHNLDLVRYLPTTGITVLLPAIIIHLLDIKAPEEGTRRSSLQGFCQCMQIMARLRDIYAAADYSTAFLEAAIRKAEISLPQKPDEIKEPRSIITTTHGLMEAGRRLASGQQSRALTPPPDGGPSTEPLPHPLKPTNLNETEIARRLNSYLASTPPDSDHPETLEHILDDDTKDLAYLQQQAAALDLEPDFDSMINLDAAGETWLLEDGRYGGAIAGESGGFALDLDWMKGMKEGGLAIPHLPDDVEGL
ncbi:C6 transcription factor (Ctf1B) [Teratosphaeria destructans]|uniref:C6 transcription factor (Ctf1B) n=1 Tax=Teratosphaeria destructans TaxID=418781 RepID=A0A9W7SXN7_9PEZI|nr:C6 transcription factor (Ctf1B) [Teratosphaeria destructans]